MGIVARIISAVLKSVVGDKLGSGLAKDLIGISIDGVSEKGLNEITDFINRGKSKIDSILSKENMKSMRISEDNIDYVVTEIKELLSKIDITDEVLRQCKYDNMNLRAFLWDKYRECKNDYIECENEIKRCLFAVAEALIKLVRESENFEKDVLIHIRNSVDDANVGLLKLSDFMTENFGKLDENSQIILSILLMILEQIQRMNMQGNETKNIEKFKNNKKQKYIENWNSRLFLHQYNDEKALTLADVFILPDYGLYKAVQWMGFFTDDTLDVIIEKFVNFNKTSTMLFTGVPGIGKTSITSWIAQKYEEDCRFIILRFRDWDIEELEEGLLKAICITLECRKKDLEQKILILDGFDEIKVLYKRSDLLQKFINDIKDFENLKLIITSRPSYIQPQEFSIYIEIRMFGVEKIKEFYYKVTNEILDCNKIYNVEVLGVPVILYMAIMTNINITAKTSKSDLYNRIFAEKGGIFDRFSNEGIAYSEGSQILRDSKNIKMYLDFLEKVAFKMFVKNSQLLAKEECSIPLLEFQGKQVSVLEFPIKHLFEDIQINIEFIHKTIYEYFLSEYVFHSIYKIIHISRLNEELANELGSIFKNNILSKEVLEFLEYRIRNSKLNSEYRFIENTFTLMLEYGMTYYVEEECPNIIMNEKRIFINMLELLHLWEIGQDEFIVSSDSIREYFFYKYDEPLNLVGVKFSDYNLGFNGIILKKANLRHAFLAGNNFSGADFCEADLTQAELGKTNLSNANFEDANLENASFFKSILVNANFQNAILNRANFENANLENANLNGAFLEDINLEGANLKNTIFNSKQLIDLEKQYNLNRTRIYIDKTMETISYKEYYRREQDILNIDLEKKQIL